MRRRRRVKRWAVCLSVIGLSFLLCHADSTGAMTMGPALYVIALACGCGGLLGLLGD